MAASLTQHWATKQAQQSRRGAEKWGQEGLWGPDTPCVRKSLEGQHQDEDQALVGRALLTSWFLVVAVVVAILITW